MDINVTIEELKAYSNENFSTYMSSVIRLALLRDASFYEWMILNFDIIMDRDDEALNQILSKLSIIMQFFITKDPDKKKEYNMLSYGKIISDGLYRYFEDKYTVGECDALGMIAASNVSYKRNLLSKEEYYEIRDMFVPFNLPISLDSFDIDAVMNIIKSTYVDLSNFTLLKKIGKGILVSDVTYDEIRTVVSELIVEWD